MSLNEKSHEPLVKLTDFGTSEYHMGFSAKYNNNKTPEYMTPENFKGPDPIDMVLADIYWYELALA
jgi:serine/threonine protein kinase